MIDILLVMTADPTQSTTPFTLVRNVNYFEDSEDTILFCMQTVFRIDEITSMDENGHFVQVKLFLTSNNDSDLHVFTNPVRKATFSNDKGWFRFGSVLLKMGQFK